MATRSKKRTETTHRGRVVRHETTVEVGDPADANFATAIRIPQAYVNAAKKIRSDIIRRGTSQIPDKLGIFTGTTCPLCTTEMKPNGPLLVCACGMAKPREATAVAGIANIIGYALTALGTLLGPEKT